MRTLLAVVQRPLALAAIAVSIGGPPAAALDPKSTHVVIVVDDSRPESMSATNRNAKRLLATAATTLIGKGFTVSIAPTSEPAARVAQPSKPVREFAAGLKARNVVFITLELSATAKPTGAAPAGMETAYSVRMSALDGTTARFLGKEEISGVLADIAPDCAKEASCLLEKVGEGMTPVIAARSTSLADRLVAMK